VIIPSLAERKEISLLQRTITSAIQPDIKFVSIFNRASLLQIRAWKVVNRNKKIRLSGNDYPNRLTCRHDKTQKGQEFPQKEADGMSKVSVIIPTTAERKRFPLLQRQ